MNQWWEGSSQGLQQQRSDKSCSSTELKQPGRRDSRGDSWLLPSTSTGSLTTTKTHARGWHHASGELLALIWALVQVPDTPLMCLGRQQKMDLSPGDPGTPVRNLDELLASAQPLPLQTFEDGISRWNTSLSIDSAFQICFFF